MIRTQLNILFVIVLVSVSQLLLAQNPNLARQYFMDGEYEKSAVLYKELSTKHYNNVYYFSNYIESLKGIEAYEEAEKALKKRIKKSPKNTDYLIFMGQLYDITFKPEKANEYYHKAIQALEPNQGKIYTLSNQFARLAKFDLSIKTLEHGGKLLKDDYVFAMNLADLYRKKSDYPLMVNQYLKVLDRDPTRVGTVKVYLQRNLPQEEFGVLQSALFTKAQADSDNVVYPELLAWVYVQKGDYNNAFRQMKALDTRNAENGFRLYDLGEVAYQELDYENAIEIFQYVVDSKGESSSYYFKSRKRILSSQTAMVLNKAVTTDEDLLGVKASYDTFFKDFGYTRYTASLLKEYAHLLAYELGDNKTAIQALDTLIKVPRVHRILQANAKLLLGDVYLMDGERWEATLLYSQVDKAFPEDELGQLARFKNAKLSYYFGDFEWAQSQFDVLKASTSKLIANDALDLSVFITDNSGLDTTYVPLELFASAELLSYQKKYDDAILLFGKIQTQFPNHELEDDIQYSKAGFLIKQKAYQEAVDLLLNLVNKYPESIRRDNALFKAAELYETVLGDAEKAQELYKQIILEHDNSTFVVEARKRFRTIRGDLP